VELSVNSHEYFMKQALLQATYAFEEDEIPVGAVLVINNKIIARAYNQTERLNDSTAHAEMIALTSGFEYMDSKYLKECTMYVTLEPCPMCAGALHWAQLGGLIYGASDQRMGYSRISEKLLHPRTSVSTGLLAAESTQLIQSFFKKLRS